MTVSHSWGLLLLAAVVGYFVGAINPASIIAHMRGIDLHDVGSGNPGATNAGRVLGKRTGVIVAVLDILKGLLPALAFQFVGESAAEMAGFMAVVGHITSPFLKGRGGKGVATTLGAVLGAHPLWVPFVLIGFVIGYVVSRRMGIGAVGGAIVLIGCGIAAAPVWDDTIYGVALGLLVLARHSRNIAAAWRDRRFVPREDGPQARG